MYCVIYFKAYNNIINGIKERFHLPDSKIYEHLRNIFINAVNQRYYADSFSIFKEIYESQFHREKLSV